MRTFTSQIVTPQIVVSYILASASHLRIFISQIFISDLYIFTFTFRSSYFETTSCLHILGSASRSRTVLSYHLQDFIMQLLLQAYNLIYMYVFKTSSPRSRANRRVVFLLASTKDFFSKHLQAFRSYVIFIFLIFSLEEIHLHIFCKLKDLSRSMESATRTVFCITCALKKEERK